DSGGGVGGGGGQVNLGASYARVNHDHTTRAALGPGVTVSPAAGAAAPDVSVSAFHAERLFVITPSAGRGATHGISGNFALARVNGVTEALIEEGADITAGSLTVEARHDLLSFSVAGAVTSAENTGIGVGVAVQRAETSTLAAVRGGEEGARTSLYAGSVTVRARTDGVIETISVAGALATQKDQTPQEPSDADQAAKPGNSRFTQLKQMLTGGGQQGGQNQGLLDTIKQQLAGGRSSYDTVQSSGDSTDITSLLKSLFQSGPDKPDEMDMDEFAAEDRQGAQDAVDRLHGDMHAEEPREPDFNPIAAGGPSGGPAPAGAGSGGAGAGGLAPMNTGAGEGATPGFGLGISGSVSVNVVRLGTDASVDGAVVDLNRGGRDLTVEVVNSTDIGAFSGSASFVRAKTGDRSAAVAGAAAVNDLANTTQARLAGADVTGAQRADVRALASGDLLSIGIGGAV